MGYLKGKSSLIFDKSANLKYKYTELKNDDLMNDKVSVKEHEEPFKGSLER
jgi:hypothetical protein